LVAIWLQGVFSFWYNIGKTLLLMLFGLYKPVVLILKLGSVVFEVKHLKSYQTEYPRP